MKSPIKYVGGKSWLAPTLSTYFDSSVKTYFSFCGGLGDLYQWSELTNKSIEAYCNDLYKPLINFWKHVQKGLVFDKLYPSTEQTYYRARDAYNRLLSKDSKLAAHLFYYLSRHSYNGYMRSDRKGNMNAPYSKKSQGKFQYYQDLTPYKDPLLKVTFSSVDFMKIAYESSSQVYLDPPYVDFQGVYSGGSFSTDQQIQVAKLAQHLHKEKGCKVIVSNYFTEFTSSLYKKYGGDIIELNVNRSFSGIEKQNKRKEILALWV